MTPTDTHALADALVAIDALYVERTERQPLIGSELLLNGRGRWEASIYPRLPGDEVERIFISSDAPDAAISGLRARVAAIPTGREARIIDAAEKTGAAIEACRAADLPDEHIAPLVAARDYITGNLLAAPVSA